MATDWRWKTQQQGRGSTSLDNTTEPLTLLASGKAVLFIAAEGTLEAAQFRGDGAQLTIDKKPLSEHLAGKLDLKTGGTITGPLQVRGNLATALPSKVDIRNDNLARVVGPPADKVASTLQVGDAVKINEQTYTVTAIDPDQSAFTLHQALARGEPRTDVTVYTDTELWVVQNGAGERKLVVDKSGHVTATSFAGAVDAQHLRGTLHPDRIPDLDARKITEGILAVGRIPNLPASKITEGELSVQRIPNLDAAKITGGTLHADRIPALPVAKVDGLQAALDGKLNATGGTIAEALAFGSTRRQMINLYSPGYGIGIQDGTQYFRTDKNFAWYKGGGHTNDALTPGTNGTVQMVIKDGNVGIGTNDPGPDKLKVQGNALIDGNLQVSIGKSVRFDLQNRGKLSLGPGAFEVDAPNDPGGRFIVTEGGNVGIGISDPGADKLKVQGNASIAGNLHVGPGSSSIAQDRVNAVYATNNIDAGIAIAQNSGVNVLLQAAGAGGYIGTTSNHPLVFRTNDQDRMAIDTNGNLRVSNGEIIGKIKTSAEFTWKQGEPPVRMWPSATSVAFLTFVSGYFYGGGEQIRIVDRDGYWWLEGQSAQKDVQGKARCIGVPPA